MPTVLELTRSSSLVFTETVQERGASSVPAVAASEKLVTVRVDRALRVDPVLGDLRGKIVTVVAAAPETLTPGQRAVFFTFATPNLRVSESVLLPNLLTSKGSKAPATKSGGTKMWTNRERPGNRKLVAAIGTNNRALADLSLAAT
jgi:hypothetical protein